MRILSWVQKKLAGRNASNKCSVHEVSKAEAFSEARRESDPPTPIQETRKEEFVDRPERLLTIGTFGNSNQNFSSIFGSSKYDSTDYSPSSRDLSDFSVEEMEKLQNDFSELLELKQTENIEEGEQASHPSNEFLNYSSNSENGRRISEKNLEESDSFTGIVLDKGNETCVENNNSGRGIKKRSLSFLLKKTFSCGRGFSVLSLKDQLPEPRIEKLLIAMFHKKIFPQKPTGIKRLVNPSRSREEEEDDTDDKPRNGYKWVKTDDEYIVLEM